MYKTSWSTMADVNQKEHIRLLNGVMPCCYPGLTGQIQQPSMYMKLNEHASPA
jgi:hypothetical protein